jgi:hypothetical protein
MNLEFDDTSETERMRGDYIDLRYGAIYSAQTGGTNVFLNALFVH